MALVTAFALNPLILTGALHLFPGTVEANPRLTVGDFGAHKAAPRDVDSNLAFGERNVTVLWTASSEQKVECRDCQRQRKLGRADGAGVVSNGK